MKEKKLTMNYRTMNYGNKFLIYFINIFTMFLGSFGGQYPQYYPYPYPLPMVDPYHNQFPTGQLPPPPPSFPPKPYSYPPQQNYPMRGPLPQGFGNYQNKGRRGNYTSGPRNFVGGKGFPGSPQKIANTYSNVKCLFSFFFFKHM